MRRRGRYVHASGQHSFRMDLVLEFDEPARSGDAGEVARRVIEALQVPMPKVPDGLNSCRLVCHELRASIALVPEGG